MASELSSSCEGVKRLGYGSFLIRCCTAASQYITVSADDWSFRRSDQINFGGIDQRLIDKACTDLLDTKSMPNEIKNP